MRTLIYLLLSITSTFGVTLEWDWNKEANLGGYIVYWGTASGAPTQHMDVGKVTSWTHDLH